MGLGLRCLIDKYYLHLGASIYYYDHEVNPNISQKSHPQFGRQSVRGFSPPFPPLTVYCQFAIALCCTITLCVSVLQCVAS